MVELICEYNNCEVKKVVEDIETALRLLEIHKRAVHLSKKEAVKKEEKENKKKEKRA